MVTTPVRLVGEGVGHAAGRIQPVLRTADRKLEAWSLDVGFETLGPRSGPATLLRLGWPSPFFAEAGYSLNGTQRYAGGLQLGSATGRRLRAAVVHVDHDEPHFWGVGPATGPGRISDYRWRRLLGTVSGQIPLSDAVEIGAELGWERNRVRRGGDGGVTDLQDRFADDELAGLGEDPKFVRLGASLGWEQTRWLLLQRRGVGLTTGATAFLGRSGTRTDFVRFEADAHGNLALTDRHALAVRALLEANRGLDGDVVPFTHLASLGSDHGARGFARDRFRDRDLAALMGEYRYEIWRDAALGVGAEGVVLGDLGAVEHDLLEIDGSDLHPSYGLGVRVVKDAELLMFGYVAFSDEETRVNLLFEWPF